MKEDPYQPFHGFLPVEHVDGSHDRDKEVGEPGDHRDRSVVQDRENVFGEILKDVCQVGLGVLQHIQHGVHIHLREALLQIFH